MSTATPIIYPPATFFPCRQHPRAGALVVLITEEHEGDMISGHYDEPLCPECGAPLHMVLSEATIELATELARERSLTLEEAQRRITGIDDRTRCPRCDYALSIGTTLRPFTDTPGPLTERIVYCDRCKWSQSATEHDHSPLERCDQPDG